MSEINPYEAPRAALSDALTDIEADWRPAGVGERVLAVLFDTALLLVAIEASPLPGSASASRRPGS